MANLIAVQPLGKERKEWSIVWVGKIALGLLFLLGFIFLIAGLQRVGSVASAVDFTVSGPCLVFPVVVFILGFKRVPEEERWLLEVFGKYYRTASGGLRWLLPWVEKLRASVSIWVQKYVLFGNKKSVIDFLDGSATPIDAIAFVQLNPNDSQAAYKMAYAVSEVATAVMLLLENAVRSYLSSLKIDEALQLGRGGYDIKSRMPKKDLNKIDKMLEGWGLVLVRITIGDFDLEETVLKARATVISAEKAAKAAEFDQKKKAKETAGFLLSALAEMRGKTVKIVQDEINKNPEAQKHFSGLFQEAMLKQMSLDADALTEIQVKGVKGGQKNLLEAIALLGEALGGALGNLQFSAPKQGKSGNPG